MWLQQVPLGFRVHGASVDVHGPSSNHQRRYKNVSKAVTFGINAIIGKEQQFMALRLFKTKNVCTITPSDSSDTMPRHRIFAAVILLSWNIQSVFSIQSLRSCSFLARALESKIRSMLIPVRHPKHTGPFLSGSAEAEHLWNV